MNIGLSDEEIRTIPGVETWADVRFARDIAQAAQKKIVEEIEKGLTPEHWYGGGWDGIVDKGITDYFMTADFRKSIRKAVGLE